MNNTNPMSRPEPWTLVAEGYASEAQPILEQYCRAAVAASGFPGAEKVLDVACGCGTLSLLIHEDVREVHSIDFSSGMLDCFDREIGRRGIHNIKTYHMDGQQLEFADDTFDWAFSSFGLMFFPDREKGFREVLRTLKPDGRVVITSWAPVSDSTAMQMMFGAMQAAFPRDPKGDDTKVLSLEDPCTFRHEMERAGFKDVSITPFDGVWPVTDVETFFGSMVRGSAPLTLLKSQLGDQEWKTKCAIMITYLKRRLTSVPTELHSRAWIGVGSKH